MSTYVAKRIRFRNGERHSVLLAPHGLPVHEVTLYLGKYRRKGKAANTIHFVCCSLALLYKQLDAARINLRERFSQGQFLTVPELERIASATQYRADDLVENVAPGGRAKVIHIARIGLSRARGGQQLKPVDIGTQASRLRYIADFLSFFSTYVGASLPTAARTQFENETRHNLAVFREHIPTVSHRAKLGARVGLSQEEQDMVLRLIDPNSPDNPWAHGYVRRRNWLIVVLLLATGMRRGELLGIQIGDLNPKEPKLQILRRADAPEDPRLVQPNAKTFDREVELSRSIMRALWFFINNDRRSIKAARAIPQLIVADDGTPLSLASITKLFAQLHEVCPGLPGKLTSHVMRHTWNERFSEQADLMGLPEAIEEKARNAQQGWSEHSKTATTYTRRHIQKKGNELVLKLQEKLDEKLS